MKIFFYKFFFILLILGSFFIVADARADYYSEGTVLSTNLLADQSDVAQITTFVAQTAIFANTTIAVQFSQDGILWYGSNNEQGGWYALSDGSNSIDIRNLNWTTANFYYRAKLITSDPYMAPILGEVRVDYSDLYLPSQFPDEGTILSTNLLSGKVDVAQITYFKVNAIIPASTSISVQFSQDGILWYGSGNIQGGWFVLADGFNVVDVRPLNWTTANFYYRARLATSDLNVTPTLMQTEVDYSDSYVPSEFPAEGTVLSTNLMSGIGMIIGDGGYFIYDIPSLPSGTGVTAQFSTDGNIWYNSSGVKGGTDTLSVGSHLTAENGLNLAALGWNNNTSFYYKLTLTTTDSSQSPEISQAGLLIDIASSVWFTFDDGYGNKAHSGDTAKSRAIGNLQPGSAGANTTATAMWDKNGLFGGAMEFDGTDDRLTITNFQLSDNTKLSISQAINFQSLETSKPIFSQWGNGDNSILIKSDNINADELRVCIASSLTDDCTNYAYTNDANFTLNRWYNIQIIYDGQQSTNDTRLKIYIDGKQKPLSFSGIIPSTLQNPLSSLEIGGDGDLASYFNGKVDEVKSSNSVLTKNEIDILKNGGSPMMMGYDSSRNNNGIRVTGAAKEYCIPGDTAKCDSPMGEWKMDEMVKGNAKTLLDASGKGNDGTTYYGANLTGMDCTIPGKFGTGCRFDGVDDYARTSSSPITGTAPFSISGWIKADVHSTYGLAISMGNASPTQAAWLGWVQAANVGTSNSLGGGFYGRNYGSGINDNNWHHLALTFSGGTNGTAILYVDGKQKVIDTYTPNLQSTAVFFGKANIDVAYQYKGLLDNVKIYNYARTPAQIAWDYNRGKPVWHWKMDEDGGLVVHDESGNGNHGTMNGMDASTDWVVGKNNKALDFDGSNDYVSVANNISSSISGTMSAWINPSGYYNDRQFVMGGMDAGGANASARYGLCVIHTGVACSNSWNAWIGNGTNSQIACSGQTYNAANFPAGVWTQISVTYDGSNVKFYKDGHSVNSVVQTYAAIGSAEPFSIGRSGALSSFGYFQGQIDDVKIYNYALTSEQVKQDYVGGSVIFE